MRQSLERKPAYRPTLDLIGVEHQADSGLAVARPDTSFTTRSPRRTRSNLTQAAEVQRQTMGMPCVLCSSVEELTDEDVIPKWLLRAFAVQPGSTVVDVPAPRPISVPSSSTATATLHIELATEFVARASTGSPPR